MTTPTSSTSSIPPTSSPTRVAFYEQLVDACLHDIALLRRGLLHWATEEGPRWEAAGIGEEQRRRRIGVARDAYFLSQQWEAAGATPGQIRKRLRTLWEEIHTEEGLDLYQAMLQRTGQAEPPQYGTPDDLVQRHALRIMLANAEAAVVHAYCAWAETTEAPDTQERQSLYDLSGVEELGLHLGMLHYQRGCYEQRPRRSFKELSEAFYTWGKTSREEFIRKYGFRPEQASTPFTPVTVEGPVDHDDYYAALRAAEEMEEEER